MAYQPKSYRKFLAGTVTAAVVASAIAPAASAAFTDVAANDTHAKNIDKAVEMGLINGYPNGTFGTYQDITRGQVAKIIARYLGNVDTTGVEQFTDVASSPDTELKAAALKVRAAGVFTGSDGALNAGKNITRQEMASVVARLFELTDIEGVESKVTDNDKAWEVHRENINLLSEYGITTEASFNPLGNVKRGQFASFIVRAIELAQEVKIEKVSALDNSGKFVEISFSKPVVGLEASDIQITDAKTGARKGVKSVSLSSNGKLATVELFAPEDAGKGEVLEYLTDYTVKVFVNGETLTATFNRPLFVEQRVTAVDYDDRKITLADAGSLEIPKTLEIDFEEVKGRTVSLWYNKDREVVKYVLDEDETVIYSPIQLDKVDEIKTLVDGESHDISDKTFQFQLNDEVEDYEDYRAENIVDNKDPEVDYAKVVLGSNGEVEFIGAYNFDGYSVVESVDEDAEEIVGVSGTESISDAVDYLVVKDGKQIAWTDVQPGDVVLFQDDAYGEDGYAVVYNNSVTGTVEEVYSTSIVVDGEEYDFIRDGYYMGNMGDAQFLNEDGEYETLTADDAKELDGEEVTLYLDAKGDLLFIGTELEVTLANTSILTENITSDLAFGKYTVQLEAVNSDGSEELQQVQLSSLDKISVNGIEYDIDDSSSRDADEYKPTVADGNIVLTPGDVTEDRPVVEISLAQKGKMVQFKTNSNEDLKEIAFFTATLGEGEEAYSVIDVKSDPEDLVGKLLEPGDTYANTAAGAKKLSDKVVVFDATDGFDADDIAVTTWGEYKGSDIDVADVLYDDDNEVVAIVIKSTTAADKVFEEAVITKVSRNTDGEVVSIEAYVNGKKQTIAVDKLTHDDADDLVKGSVALLTFSKNNLNLVKDIELSDARFKTSKIVKNVDVGAKKVTVTDQDGTNEVTYTLVTDGAVLDSTNNDSITTKSLSDLRGKNNVTVVLDEETGTFAKYFVIEPNNAVEEEDEEDEVTTVTGTITLDKTAYAAGDTVTITVDDADVNVDSTKIEEVLVTVTGANPSTITLKETSANSGKFRGTTTAVDDITVTYYDDAKSDGTAGDIVSDTVTVTTAAEAAKETAIERLNAAINDDSVTEATDYTEASWATYTTALEAAKALNTTTATTTEINEAAEALETAIAELVPAS